MYSCEGTGKNIEQAIQNALLELKASREDVDIKILNEGGFLKKAKVLVTISEDAREKYEKKEKLKQNLREEKNDEDFAEDFIKQKIASVEKEVDEEEKALEKQLKKEIKTEEKKVKKEEKSEEKSEKKIRISADDEISEKHESKPEKSDRAEKERKLTGEEFLAEVLKTSGLEGEIEKSEDDRFVRYSVVGENVNELIGHHGECMFALSHLMNLVCKTPDHKRIVLDVGDYRKKREESLTSLAKSIANKVAKSGRYYKLEPMDASERKIIHTALQEDDRVTTLSKGEEPKRYLIVFPKEYKD